MLDDHADIEVLLADPVEEIEDDENWAEPEPESPVEQISYPPAEDMQQPPTQSAPR
jgi:hypothetical protein